MTLFSLLVVEDNPDDANLIIEFLADELSSDFHVDVATTLADAIDILSKKNFDSILLDLNLPDSTGLDTVRQLINRYPNVAIIVLTSISEDKMAVESVQYGAQDYLEKKDISSRWLARSIRYATERKRLLGEKETLLADLASALDEIEQLQIIIPICVNCKKIRHDSDEWETVADYLKRKADTAFSHCICPECLNLLYPAMKSSKEKQP